MKCQIVVLAIAAAAGAAFGDGFVRMTDAASGFNGLNPQGGAFAVNTDTPSGGPQGYIGELGGAGGSATSFLSFCIERNEGLHLGGLTNNLGASNRYFSRISTAAYEGGQGGGNPDPVGEQTALLYSTFRRGGAIAGYVVDGVTDYGPLTASGITSALQFAIWKLEEEVTNYNGLTADYRPVAQAMENWAIANAVTGQFYGVRVLNMYEYNGSGSRTDPSNYTVNAQDQLALIPVPLPTAGALAFAGLAAMGVRSRRRAF